jgi:DNA-binding protein Fis
MNQATMDGNREIQTLNSDGTINGNGQKEQPRSSVMALKALASRLMREVECLNEVRTVEIHDGIDFYDQVTEFEIGLIRRALSYTHGHQGRAARLLNLKVTTLNSKIKQYHIKIDGFANGYPVLDTTDMELRHV